MCDCARERRLSMAQAERFASIGVHHLACANEVFSELLVTAQAAGAEDLATRVSALLKSLGGAHHIAREVPVLVLTLDGEAARTAPADAPGSATARQLQPS